MATLFRRAHMMTICLVFWFFTISASATAVSIYLIKMIEIESKKQQHGKGDVTTADPSGRIFNKHPEESAYEDYNILGFLLEAMYAEGDEEDSHNRSKEAEPGKGKHHRTKTTRKTPSTEYDYNDKTDESDPSATDYPYKDHTTTAAEPEDTIQTDGDYSEDTEETDTVEPGGREITRKTGKFGRFERKSHRTSKMPDTDRIKL